MKVLYSWLQDHVTTPLPQIDAAAEILTAHVGEVDELIAVHNDTVIDIKILPDRAHYLLSHQGIARELAYFSGSEFNAARKTPLVPTLGALKRGVRIEAPERCVRYCAQEITNVSIPDTPPAIATRLEAIGQKSINAIVDIGNYVMFETGQPIHVFDAAKVVGDITVRLAKDGETIVLLTGEEVTLTSDDLVVADTAGPLAIAGVKGGKRAEVTRGTTHLVVEAANFAPVGIRKTATRLNLRNDSSKRFENEITPAFTMDGIALVAALVSEISPAATATEVLDVYPAPQSTWTVTAKASDISILLGIAVTPEHMCAILKGMGCEVMLSGDSMTITPPLSRLDLCIVEDIADEIGRSIGYAQLPAILPPALPVVATPDPLFYHAEHAKNVLMERGYHEALLYSLVAKGYYEIVYPLAKDKSALRERLVPGLIQALRSNTRNADFLALEVVRMCEVGKVFTAAGEHLSMALGVLPIKKQKGVTAESLLREDITALETALGCTLTVSIETGEFGAVAEFDLEALVSTLGPAATLATLGFTSLPDDVTYQKISPYPFMIRDVAVFVPESVTAAEVESVITQHAGDLCVKHWLFDVFTKTTETGVRHSYAFRLIFQSFDRTLIDVDIEPQMDAVYTALRANADWEIR